MLETLSKAQEVCPATKKQGQPWSQSRGQLLPHSCPGAAWRTLPHLCRGSGAHILQHLPLRAEGLGSTNLGDYAVLQHLEQGHRYSTAKAALGSQVAACHPLNRPWCLVVCEH